MDAASAFYSVLVHRPIPFFWLSSPWSVTVPELASSRDFTPCLHVLVLSQGTFTHLQRADAGHTQLLANGRRFGPPLNRFVRRAGGDAFLWLSRSQSRARFGPY